ncbi:MAG: LCP family protein [Ruminococcus sp.]|nr:LCP family protein [Ruminococcus sp.]
MNEMDNNEEIIEGSGQAQSKPKPLRKLKRVNPSRAEQPAAQHYVPEHEAAPGSHSAGHEGYVPKHEAPPHRYVGKHEAIHDDRQYVDEMYEEFEDEKPVKKGKKGSRWKDPLVKTVAILTSLVLICVLILNLPILWYKKNGVKERVSIITYFKRWQPLVEIEGEIDKTNIDPKVNTNVIPDDDGLDLPQLVEGQYTVLFLGFDEDIFNTDVMWICQFDILAGKLRILQIPRDSAVPDFTSSPNTKFNSIYSLGDQNINPPINRVVNAIYQCFGIPIDAYVTTTCFDIVDLVDCVGGIPMTLDAPIQYDGVTIVDSGDVVLNGVQAEWFIRYRQGWLEGDIGRMQNQRRFMAAAMQKMLNISKEEGKTKLYSYMKQIYDHKWIATDMSIEDLSKLIDFTSNLSMDSVQVDMIPGEGSDGTKPYFGPDGREYSIFSIHLQETLDLLNKYYRPYQQPLTRSDTAIVEWITDHVVDNYDDKTQTLDAVLNGAEPARTPN